MKKTIFKKLMTLSLAFCALFVISNNVFADETTIGEIGTDIEVTCYGRGGGAGNGYYYCNGLTCYYVNNTDPAQDAPSSKCKL